MGRGREAAALPADAGHLEVLGPIADVRAVPLADPIVEHSVGLIAVDRDPISPLVLAAFDCARTIMPPAIARAELALRD